MLGSMRISDKAVDEFIQIYREEFGEELDRSDASEMAFRLVTLYEALVKRLPSDARPRSTGDSLQRKIGFRV
jgi:hypothetical protein